VTQGSERTIRSAADWSSQDSVDVLSPAALSRFELVWAHAAERTRGDACDCKTDRCSRPRR
jgi:hypothetical protein